MAKKLYYIGERVNPQLCRSYYVAYGQLGVRAANKIVKCSYGEVRLTSFETVAEFEAHIVELEAAGFSVYRRGGASC